MIKNSINNTHAKQNFGASGLFKPRFPDSLRKIASTNIIPKNPEPTRFPQHVTDSILENITKLANEKEIKQGAKPNTFYQNGETPGKNLNIIVSDFDIKIEHGDTLGVTELSRDLKYQDDIKFNAAIKALNNLKR